MFHSSFEQRIPTRLFLCQGRCNQISNGTFQCHCSDGWTGSNCEELMDSCRNVTCMNNGICRASLLNYTCECVGESFFGRHCEQVQKGLIARQTISKSFGYIAILFLSAVALFFFTMDVLKYFFGIDLTEKEMEKIQQKKPIKSKPPRRPQIALRFIYVHAPPAPNQPMTHP